MLRCIGFDSPAEIAGTYGDNFGILPGATTPVLDTTEKASGSSSLKFTVPSMAGSDVGGSFFTNFSADLSTQFGQNQTFYVQWRQRFSPEFINNAYRASSGDRAGWKQSIIGVGDKPGGMLASSCTTLEIVTTNYYGAGFPIQYNSCTGSTSHGAYDGFFQPFASSDFKLENGVPSPYCLYSQGHTTPTTFFPPDGNCFAYLPNDWMTFQVEVQTGLRVADEFANSHVSLWGAREGRASELLIDWGPYNLSAGSAADDLRYGKVWLLPYMTGKDPSQSLPIAYTWYDELVISTSRIADPQ